MNAFLIEFCKNRNMFPVIIDFLLNCHLGDTKTLDFV